MRIQIIRKDGRIHGLAIVRGQGKVLAAQQGSTYWRICEHCCENEANVFCKTHARFVCVRCLSFHGKQSVGGNFILGYACRLVSLAHYRELAKRIDDEMHDEPRAFKQSAPLSTIEQSAGSASVVTAPDGYVEGEDDDCQPSFVSDPAALWVEQYGQHPNVRQWLRDNPPPREWSRTPEAYAFAEMPIRVLEGKGT